MNAQEIYSQHPWVVVIILLVLLSPVAYGIWDYYQKNKRK